MLREPTRIPRYDKGACDGQGDRRPASAWQAVNAPGQPPVQVVVLEGWLVGFRPLSPDAVRRRRDAPSRTLHKHRLEHLLFVNDKLRAYDPLTDLLDVLVHLDAPVDQVYRWRQEQEDGLRAQRQDPAAGMTPDQVIRFVDGYVPGYELWVDGVRAGIFTHRPGCQLRMVVGRDRNVTGVIRI